jgi:hypothetical protein
MEFQQKLVGWSLSHFGFPFHVNSNGIGRNLPEMVGILELPGASGNDFHWNSIHIPGNSNGKYIPNGLSDSIGICWNMNGIPILQSNSNRFQQIPMECNVRCSYYYTIKNKWMAKD